ncbi:MAG: DNA glycosylase [Candidatus Bathyarchaeia archaeon]
MEIKLEQADMFNLDATLCCGQAFRWTKHEGWWYGVVEGNVIKIRQAGQKLEFENADADFVKNYFSLDHDLPAIFLQICKDEHIKKAIETFKGLRILRQEPWECLISYVCATYKNVSAIACMLQNLSQKFGEELFFENKKFYAFPTTESLANASIRDLEDCGLGFRAKYVSEVVKLVNRGLFDLERLKTLTFEEARNELLSLRGVGMKVADCILLFSLEKLEAFPVDVWVRRALLRHYSSHFPKEFVEKMLKEKTLNKTGYLKLSLFGQKYFGRYAGYAQEYLYHYERSQT